MWSADTGQAGLRREVPATKRRYRIATLSSFLGSEDRWRCGRASNCASHAQASCSIDFRHCGFSRDQPARCDLHKARAFASPPQQVEVCTRETVPLAEVLNAVSIVFDIHVLLATQVDLAKHNKSGAEPVNGDNHVAPMSQGQ